MINDIKIDASAASMTVTFPLVLNRRGVARSDDLRVQIDDVEQGLLLFDHLAKPDAPLT